VCLTVTSYCNYDCLMCPHGEEGRLDDQLTPAFYDDLRALLPGVLVLEANGGEPLASPHFRTFLEGLDGRELPQLRVNLITNGSYLGPKQLDRFANVPWGNLTFSLNAASAETYLLVNRGLAYEKVRGHLDDLLARRQAGTLRADVTYSMVILRQNLHEVEAFAELALRDDVVVRYMLPFRDRHGSSILTDRGCMLEALRALQAVAARLLERGRGKEARGVLASARVLLQRLDLRVVAAL
jgi:MoaA/NifB/PqqE/SkfB family radical SAM enzyme